MFSCHNLLCPLYCICIGAALLNDWACAEKTNEVVDLRVPCPWTLFVEFNQSYRISFKTNKTKLPDMCHVSLQTTPNHLIRLDILYYTGNNGVGNCSRAYVHIGNDERRPDVEMGTSYKFCQSVREEIVSRDNFVWIVYRRSQNVTDEMLTVNIRAEMSIQCNDSMFSCSPVQCIDSQTICDGWHDCYNGRDEYCAPSYVSSTTSRPCFLCANDLCIDPVLPRYDEEWGRSYWYLCDEHDHCLDGSDERKDICYRIKSKSDGLFQCIPSKYRSEYNGSALMWDDVLCDGVEDCLYGEDERHSQCQVPIDERRVDTVAVLLVVFFVFAVSAGSVCSLRLLKKRKDTDDQLCQDSAITANADHCPSEVRRLQDLEVIDEETELRVSSV